MGVIADLQGNLEEAGTLSTITPCSSGDWRRQSRGKRASKSGIIYCKLGEYPKQ